MRRFAALDAKTRPSDEPTSKDLSEIKLRKRVSVRKKNSKKTRNNNHRRVENFEGSKVSLALGDLSETKTQFFSESTLHLHRQVRDTHEAFVCH